MLVFGGSAFWSMLLILRRTESDVSSSRVRIADSTFAMISAAGTRDGVMAKLRPFFRSLVSASVRDLEERWSVSFIHSTDMNTYHHIDLRCFRSFRNCSLFCTFWLFWNFYTGEAHHANHCKHSLNHHFRHGADSVYKIYSVFKLFEIAVCSAHFDFFEITTPVMRIMLTMANIV